MNEKKNLTIKEAFDLAVQNRQKNNLEVAENLYREILKTNPNHFESIFDLGALLAQTKRFDLAKPLFQKAIQINPNYAKAHNNLGIVLQDLGEHQKAKSFYQMAVKYEPENLAHLYNLSRLDEKILYPNLKNKIYEIIEKNNSTKKNIAYGNFLLSRYELKAKKYKNEFDYLLKGHQYYFESENKKLKKKLNIC